jgi:hypothetical protein
MTCFPPQSVTLRLWSSLCYCFILTYSHVQSSFAALSFHQASMRPKTGLAAPTTIQQRQGNRLDHQICSQTFVARTGQLKRAANQVRGWAVNSPRDLLFVEPSADDLASRRTRSAASFALRLSYANRVATEHSLANADFIKAVRVVMCTKPNQAHIDFTLCASLLAFVDPCSGMPGLSMSTSVFVRKEKR